MKVSTPILLALIWLLVLVNCNYRKLEVEDHIDLNRDLPLSISVLNIEGANNINKDSLFVFLFSRGTKIIIYREAGLGYKIYSSRDVIMNSEVQYVETDFIKPSESIKSHISNLNKSEFIENELGFFLTYFSECNEYLVSHFPKSVQTKSGHKLHIAIQVASIFSPNIIRIYDDLIPIKYSFSETELFVTDFVNYNLIQPFEIMIVSNKSTEELYFTPYDCWYGGGFRSVEQIETKMRESVILANMIRSVLMSTY